jgi:hypothetical protein
MNNQLILAQGSQEQTVQRLPELSPSSPSDALIPNQEMRVAFVRRQEHRLNQLIEEGHLSANSRNPVWIDENGLLTAQHLSYMSNEQRQQPAPPFHGRWINVDEIAPSPMLSRSFWGQEDPEEETQIWGSLLQKLVMKELKLLPTITHSTWKELLADIERSTTAYTASPIMEQKLRAAIQREQEDWDKFVHLENSCKHFDVFLAVDLDNISPALYRLAGVNSNSETTLGEIDEGLVDDITILLVLASQLQEHAVSPISLTRLTRLAEDVNNLSAIFLRGKMGPLMTTRLQAVEKKRKRYCV